MPLLTIARYVLGLGLVLVALVLAFYFAIMVLVIGGCVWLYFFLRTRFFTPANHSHPRDFASVLNDIEQHAATQTHDANETVARTIEGQYETVSLTDLPSDSDRNSGLKGQ